jgi:hypothetical protein
LHSCSSYLWCFQLLNFPFGFLARFRTLAMLNASFVWNLWKTIPFPNLKSHMCPFLFLFFVCILFALTFYITLLVDLMQEMFFSAEQVHQASSSRIFWHHHPTKFRLFLVFATLHELQIPYALSLLLVDLGH